MKRCFRAFGVSPVVLGLLCILWAPKAIYGSSSAQVRQAPLPGQVPSSAHSEYRETYVKANETLSLDVLYTLEKTDALEKLSTAKKKENLKRFCLTQESGRKCFERFKAFQVHRLRTQSGSIGRNLEAIGRLRGKGGAMVSSPLLDSKGRVVPPRPPLPEAPTFVELQQRRERELQTLTQLASDDYVEWQGDVPMPPEKGDFVLYEKVLQDPKGPDSSVWRAVTTCGQPVCIDEKAYEKELQAHQNQLKAHSEDSLYASLQKKPFQVQRGGKLDLDVEGQESVQAYHEARRVMVDAANELISGKGGAEEELAARQLSSSVGHGDGKSPATGDETFLPFLRKKDERHISVRYNPEVIAPVLEQYGK